MLAVENESAAFEAAILASPNDAAPRLVYADWLEERGRAERAEFVRAQIRKPRGWNFRALALLRANYRQWGLADVGEAVQRADEYCVTFRGFSAEYRGGFIEDLACHQGDWLANGPDLVRRLPLRRVWFPGIHSGEFYGPHQVHLGRIRVEMLLHWPGGGDFAFVANVASFRTFQDAWNAVSQMALSWAKAQGCDD
jgi:uncharacterized protein (TIGR02996 family)